MILLSKLFKSFILLSHLMRMEALLYSRSSSNDYSSDHNQKRSYLRFQEHTPTQREIIDELFSSLLLNIYEDDECESDFITCEKGIVKKVEVKHYSKIWSTHDAEEQGQIPHSIGLLTNLEEIVLDGVPDLGGTLPTELGSLTKLQTLRLADNSFLGQVPTELGSLTNLEWLDLGFNALTGNIPSELGNFSDIKRLSLGHNMINGEIPKEFGKLNKVEMIDLSYNRLTGTIPTELEALKNLKWFELYDNSLTGRIPDELKTLSSLEEINLDSTTPLTSELTFTSYEGKTESKSILL